MTTLDQLIQMIPQDLAIANKALAVSLEGITNIGSLTLPRFANAVANVQTTYGLPLISAQTSAVSAATVNSLLSSIGGGTGQGGTIQIDNILGTAAGHVSANALINSTTIINSMPVLGNAGNASSLTGIYTYMADVVNGVFGDPIAGPVTIPNGPANGIYDSATLAFIGEVANTDPGSTSTATGGIGLISAAQAELSHITSAAPSQVSSLNANWANIMNQLALEQSTQAKASLNFTQLTPNSTSSIYSFVFSLPQYGQDTTVGGMSQFIQGVADVSNLTGQAIIAVLRQGQTNLPSTGIGGSSQIPADPNPPLAKSQLTPAQYPYP